MSWRDFWNRDNSIYVNDRHRTLHDNRIAHDIDGLIERPDAIVLDFGCGEASAAAQVATRCARLYLYDAAPKVREHLRVRFGRNAAIEVLERHDLLEVDDACLDLIVVNSVLQYVPHGEFVDLLGIWRSKLKPTGTLALADIIGPDSSAIADIQALLRFAWRGGFLVAAGTGLVTTFFSDYRKLRNQFGLTRYSEREMLELLAAHGFVASRALVNLGHNQTRMMFTARPGPVHAPIDTSELL